jgi:Pyruvate/2-oxoacid:ferredoxin oxidoreductase gamma subunit
LQNAVLFLKINILRGGQVERELIMTGIGGQGIQLAASVVARAAMAEGRHVQVFGSYGGMMRGGNTEATVVVADAPVEAPPTISATWSAIVMHPAHAEGPLRLVRPGGIVLVNATVFDHVPTSAEHAVVGVPATALALDLGNAVATSMVMVGAYAGATGLVALSALKDAARAALPPYRAKHADLNERALQTGFAAAPRLVVGAWDAAPATTGS